MMMSSSGSNPIRRQVSPPRSARVAAPSLSVTRGRTQQTVIGTTDSSTSMMSAGGGGVRRFADAPLQPDGDARTGGLHSTAVAAPIRRIIPSASPRVLPPGGRGGAPGKTGFMPTATAGGSTAGRRRETSPTPQAVPRARTPQHLSTTRPRGGIAPPTTSSSSTRRTATTPTPLATRTRAAGGGAPPNRSSAIPLHHQEQGQEGFAAITAAQYDPLAVPEHLRYKKPRTGGSYRGVAARYATSPMREVDRDAYYAQHAPPKEAVPRNPMFENVEPRYDLPSSSRMNSPSRTGGSDEPLAPHESIRMTAEYEEHKDMAARAGFGQTQPKYFDCYLREQQSAGQPTPRDVVDAKMRKKENALERKFRVSSNRPDTFSAMEKDNQELKRWTSVSPERRQRRNENGFSVVMEYVTKGTAIPGMRQQSPEEVRRQHQSHEPRMGGRVFYGAGGAGGGTFGRKANSPLMTQADVIEKKVLTRMESAKSMRTRSPPRVSRAPFSAQNSGASALTQGEAANSAATNRIQYTLRGGGVNHTSASNGGVVAGRTKSPSPTRPRGVQGAGPAAGATAGANRSSPTRRAVGAIVVPKTNTSRNVSTSPTRKTNQQQQSTSPTRRAVPAAAAAAVGGQHKSTTSPTRQVGTATNGGRSGSERRALGVTYRVKPAGAAAAISSTKNAPSSSSAVVSTNGYEHTDGGDGQREADEGGVFEVGHTTGHSSEGESAEHQRYAPGSPFSLHRRVPLLFSVKAPKPSHLRPQPDGSEK